jgi:AcrR family transcriptional regulator
VDAAIEVVEAEGPDALGVSRVARALGIKPPSLYNHVGKGNALPRAVLLEGNRRLLAALEEALDGLDDPAERVRRIARTLRAWALANRHLYALMARIPPDNDDPAFAPVLTALLDLVGGPFVRPGQSADARIHAIRGFRAAIHGFVLLETTGQFALGVDREESFAWLVEALVPVTGETGGTPPG